MCGNGSIVMDLGEVSFGLVQRWDGCTHMVRDLCSDSYCTVAWPQKHLHLLVYS